MQPALIISIFFVLIIILITVLSMPRKAHPKLSEERHTELNGLLMDEEAIRNQLRRGNKIMAIKMYREQTGIGLKEAKDAVEMMEQEGQHAMIAEIAEMYSSEAAEGHKGMDEIEYMLTAGNKINAIKIYRQRTGVGLKEAKDAIDRMALELKTARSERSNQTDHGLVDPDELQRLIRAGKKIQAIKYYRETTGVDLKEAKDAVDALAAQIYLNM